MSCNHEYQRLLSKASASSSSSKSAPVSSASSSYGTLDKEVKVGRQNSKTVQCISKKIRRQFSVILVAVLIFMVKDGALGVDKVLDTLELNEFLDVKKEEASNSLNANEDPSETLSEEQIEALFLAFGFSLSVVLLAVSNTTVICLLGTLAAVSSTSMSLLILNFDYFLSFKGNIFLISSLLTCVGWTMLTLTGIAGVVNNFKTRRLSILALLMSLGFVGEIFFRKLNIFLLKHFGYNVAAGIMIGFILISGLMGSVLKSPKRNDNIPSRQTFFSSVVVLIPNLIGSFFFSLGVSNIFNNFFPEDVNVPVMNISIILGLCVAGFLGERHYAHPSSMLAFITLFNTLAAIVLVSMMSSSVFYIINFLVGLKMATINYTLVKLLPWSQFCPMFSVVMIVRCIGWAVSPALVDLVTDDDDDDVGGGYMSCVLLAVSCAVYFTIAGIKHAKEQYHAVIRDHIENSETTVLVDVDSGDDDDYDSPIDIICCEQSSEERLEETTAPGEISQQCLVSVILLLKLRKTLGLCNCA